MQRRLTFVPVFLVAILAVFVANADAASDAPRPGKYRIMSYGAVGRPPLFLGYFVLGSGTYKAFLAGDKPAGEGRYSYHAATHTIKWESGPYAGVWGGEFTIEREGKTHKIRMKSSTIATNNTD